MSTAVFVRNSEPAQYPAGYLRANLRVAAYPVALADVVQKEDKVREHRVAHSRENLVVVPIQAVGLARAKDFVEVGDAI